MIKKTHKWTKNDEKILAKISERKKKCQKVNIKKRKKLQEKNDQIPKKLSLVLSGDLQEKCENDRKYDEIV